MNDPEMNENLPTAIQEMIMSVWSRHVFELRRIVCNTAA